MFVIRLLLGVFLAIPLGGCAATTKADSEPKDETQVILFPTAGHQSPDASSWLLPIHGWTYDPRLDSGWRESFVGRLPGILGLEPDEQERRLFEQRGRMFLVQDLPSDVVRISSGGTIGAIEPAQSNGHFVGNLRIPVQPGGGAADGDWISYDAVSGDGAERRFAGKSQLVGRDGWSVVSDIDDTIKLSNVASKRELLKATFFEPFRPVPGMSGVYRSWAGQGAVFHYVSGSPWQLYPALADFMSVEGFPDGSYHLKTIRFNDETFFDLFGSQDGHKKPVIERLLETWPERRFVFIGDAGEQDPEIFAAVAGLHPRQVAAVLIRDERDQADADPRYLELFKDLPNTRWAIFSDGTDLSNIILMPQQTARRCRDC